MSADILFSNLSSCSGILPVIVALYNYKHLDKILRIVAVFFFISALFDLSLMLTTMVFHLYNNLPAIHLFILTSIFFFGAIYYLAFFNPEIKKAVVVVSVAAAIAVIMNSIFNEKIWVYPSLSNTILSVILIVFSLVYFYQLFNRQEFVHIEKQGLFWINAGVLFYFSLNLFLFMLFKRIIAVHMFEYYMIHNIVNIIANILYSVGLLCKPQKTTT